MEEEGERTEYGFLGNHDHRSCNCGFLTTDMIDNSNMIKSLRYFTSRFNLIANCLRALIFSRQMH